jgi:hypothetical protein
MTKPKPEKPTFVPIKELPKVDIHHNLFFRNINRIFALGSEVLGNQHRERRTATPHW